MTDPTATVTADDYYAIIPEWLLDTASPRAIQVYGFLRRYADKSSLESIPSRATLAKRARCSRNTIDRAIKELEDIGAVSVTARFDEHGDRTSNLYHLHRMPIGGPTTGDTPTATDGDTPGPTNGAQNYSPSVPQSGEPQLATTSRRRDPVWDTLVQLFGEPAPNRTKLYGRVTKYLHTVDADPDTIRHRAARIVTDWGPEKLTITSLESHWSRFDGQAGQVTAADIKANQKAQRRADLHALLEDTS